MKKILLVGILGIFLSFTSLVVIGGIAYSKDIEPTLTVSEPNTNTTIKNDQVVIKGTYEPKDRKVWVNGKQISASGGVFETTYELKEGENKIDVSAGDWKRVHVNLVIIRELTDAEKEVRITPTLTATIAPSKTPKATVTLKPTIKPTVTPKVTSKAIPTATPTPHATTWHQVLFDIGEWNVNNGETTTSPFQITSNTWRIRWAKRSLTQMSIEVFDSNGNPYGTALDDPFVADFGETEGTLDFTGIGTYRVHFLGGTSKSAGEWDITVEELQ